MPSTTHTPGPWTPHHTFSSDSAAGYVRYIQNDQMEHIAHVCNFSDALDEARANAYLIAAAPDLLAALNYLQSMPNDPRAHRAALDAIAKATGGKP